MSINFRDDQEIFSLKVDDHARAMLLETMRWTKFAGIIFAIVVALLSLALSFAFGYYLPTYANVNQSGGMYSLVFMLIFVIGTNFYPIFALLKFSHLIKKAIENHNQQQFHQALKYLKNLFKYIGIFTIVLVLVYGLAIGASLMQAGA